MKKVVLAVLLFLPLMAQAADIATESLLSHLRPIESMSAHFQQLTLGPDGQQLQSSEGDMLVARGNKFRWHATQPYEQLVVANGKQVWVYDRGLQQVVIKPLKKQMTSTPALLFGGTLDEVKNAFDVSMDASGANRSHFVLKPRDDRAMFNQLEVSFEDGVPSSMRLMDSLGHKTLINFSDVKLNPGFKKGIFEFTPPTGVDVIKQNPHE